MFLILYLRSNTPSLLFNLSDSRKVRRLRDTLINPSSLWEQIHSRPDPFTVIIQWICLSCVVENRTGPGGNLALPEQVLVAAVLDTGVPQGPEALGAQLQHQADTAPLLPPLLPPLTAAGLQLYRQPGQDFVETGERSLLHCIPGYRNIIHLKLLMNVEQSFFFQCVFFTELRASWSLRATVHSFRSKLHKNSFFTWIPVLVKRR